MLKVNLVCVGKIREKFYRDAAAEYAMRLSRFVSLNIVEIAEKTEGAAEKNLLIESESIKKHLKGTVIALASEGKKLTSEGFSKLLSQKRNEGSEITFVIGSSHGLADEIKGRADLLLSFSDMTFPHMLMRVIFLEQLYRAFMIESGGEYHK